jgi:hypothetical protein
MTKEGQNKCYLSLVDLIFEPKGGRGKVLIVIFS